MSNRYPSVYGSGYHLLSIVVRWPQSCSSEQGPVSWLLSHKPLLENWDSDSSTVRVNPPLYSCAGVIPISRYLRHKSAKTDTDGTQMGGIGTRCHKGRCIWRESQRRFYQRLLITAQCNGVDNQVRMVCEFSPQYHNIYSEANRRFKQSSCISDWIILTDIKFFFLSREIPNFSCW